MEFPLIETCIPSFIEHYCKFELSAIKNKFSIKMNIVANISSFKFSLLKLMPVTDTYCYGFSIHFAIGLNLLSAEY